MACTPIRGAYQSPWGPLSLLDKLSSLASSQICPNSRIVGAREGYVGFRKVPESSGTVSRLHTKMGAPREGIESMTGQQHMVLVP